MDQGVRPERPEDPGNRQPQASTLTAVGLPDLAAGSFLPFVILLPPPGFIFSVPLRIQADCNAGLMLGITESITAPSHYALRPADFNK